MDSNQMSGNPQDARAWQRPPGNLTGRRGLTTIERRQWPQHSIGYRHDELGVLGVVPKGRYVIRRGIIGLEPMPRRIAS